MEAHDGTAVAKAGGMRSTLLAALVVVALGFVTASPAAAQQGRVAKAKVAIARSKARVKVKADWVRSKVTGKPSKYRDGQVISLGRKTSVAANGRTTDTEHTMRVGPRGRLSAHETRTIESGGGKPTYRAVDQHESNRRFFKVDYKNGASDFHITSFAGRGRNRTATHTVTEKRGKGGRLIETGLLDRVTGSRETTTFHRNGSRTITERHWTVENGVGAERVVSRRTVPRVRWRKAKSGPAKTADEKVTAAPERRRPLPSKAEIASLGSVPENEREPSHRGVKRQYDSGLMERDRRLSGEALKLTKEHGRSIPSRFPDKRVAEFDLYGGDVRLKVYTDTWVMEGRNLPNVSITVERRGANGKYHEIAESTPGYNPSSRELRPELAESLMREVSAGRATVRTSDD